eukprot:361655-Chlamydomonas_euryale.AAC.5
MQWTHRPRVPRPQGVGEPSRRGRGSYPCAPWQRRGMSAARHVSRHGRSAVTPQWKLRSTYPRMPT